MPDIKTRRQELVEPVGVLSTRELASRWHIHPMTVRRGVAAGTFPVRPIVGIADHRFPLAAVEAVERAASPTVTS